MRGIQPLIRSACLRCSNRSIRSWAVLLSLVIVTYVRAQRFPFNPYAVCINAHKTSKVVFPTPPSPFTRNQPREQRRRAAKSLTDRRFERRRRKSLITPL
ncbi:hypothetical protein GE09DRAFT_1147870 [Coniochaeta sp. 2T2.1]|nr:hypothetical protein GE09DRAFT_1147870 [Coniochaeta sp. 2T2.1]